MDNEKARISMKKLRDKRKSMGLCECGSELRENQKRCDKCTNRISELNKKRRLRTKKYVKAKSEHINMFMYNRMEYMGMTTALLSAITGISQRQIERMITDGAVPRPLNAEKINKALKMTIF